MHLARAIISSLALPNLTSWAEDHLSSTLKATTTDGFNSALDLFLSTSVQVTFNGQPLSHDDYKDQLIAESAADKDSVSLTFTGVTHVSQIDKVSGQVLSQSNRKIGSVY